MIFALNVKNALKYKISQNDITKVNDIIILRRCVEMAKCEICGKGRNFGIQISHSHRRSNRDWKPNIKRVRMDINGVTKRRNVCTSCIRSSKKTV